MNRDTDVEQRIEALAAEAEAAGESFEPPTSPPDEERAMTIVREHIGPVVSVFVEVRTGGRSVFLPPEQYDRLESTMNTWLSRYAACYGVSMDADCQLRTAAELLVETHNARDVAQILTGVPERHEQSD